MFSAKRIMFPLALAAALILTTSAVGASKTKSSKPRSTRSERSSERVDKSSAPDKIEAARKGVQASVEEFYVALSDVFKGRMSPIADIWMHTPDVTLMGAFGGRQTGWDQIKAQYDRESKLKLLGHVEPKDVVIQMVGDMACVVCTEHGQGVTADGKPVEFDLRATSVFRRDREGGGKWKLIHHHTETSPELQSATGFVPKPEPTTREHKLTSEQP
jgi:ketosteroid isomerase-like protein